MMYGPLADVKKKKIVLESLFDIPNFHLIYIKVVYKERYRYEISIFCIFRHNSILLPFDILMIFL